MVYCSGVKILAPFLGMREWGAGCVKPAQRYAISDEIDIDSFLTAQLSGTEVCHAVCYYVENLPSIDILRDSPERICI